MYQIPLLVNKFDREAVTITLSDLPEDRLLPSPEPTAALLADLRENGQRHLIDVTEEPNGYWFVLDGARRIKALRALGRGTIDAMYVHGVRDPIDRAAWATAANALRGANPVMEARKVAEMAARNMSEREIAAALHLTRQEVRKVSTLLKLPDTIQAGVERGDIALGTAYAVARLPDSRQQRLADKFFASGKLTGQDVAEVRQITVDLALGALALPGMEFTPEPERYAVIADGAVAVAVMVGQDQARSLKAADPALEVYRLVRA